MFTLHVHPAVSRPAEGDIAAACEAALNAMPRRARRSLAISTNLYVVPAGDPRLKGGAARTFDLADGTTELALSDGLRGSLGAATIARELARAAARATGQRATSSREATQALARPATASAAADWTPFPLAAAEMIRAGEISCYGGPGTTRAQLEGLAGDLAFVLGYVQFKAAADLRRLAGVRVGLVEGQALRPDTGAPVNAFHAPDGNWIVFGSAKLQTTGSVATLAHELAHAAGEATELGAWRRAAAWLEGAGIPYEHCRDKVAELERAGGER